MSTRRRVKVGGVAYYAPSKPTPALRRQYYHWPPRRNRIEAADCAWSSDGPLFTNKLLAVGWLIVLIMIGVGASLGTEPERKRLQETNFLA
jgi:hypothetical protein